jgi:hypothetical protein
LTGRFANIGGKLTCPDCAKKPKPTETRGRSSSTPARPTSTPLAPASQQPATGMMGLLQWAKNRTEPYGHEIKNWTKSWADGMAYCAIFHSYHPELIDYYSLKPENAEQNIKAAYTVAEKLGIPELLDPEDFGLEKLSMMTQMSEVYKHFNKAK